MSRELKEEARRGRNSEDTDRWELLIICKPEEQKDKSLWTESVCKKKVRESRILGESRME